MAATSLIVGGNRGIGLGLVKEALKLHSDSIIFATARDPARATELQELRKTYDSRLFILKVDVLDEASIAAAGEEVKKHTPTLDTVIVNAGVALGEGRIGDLKAEDFLQNLNANVIGPHNITKGFAPFLLASKSEKKELVYISSAVGSVTALPMIGGFIKAMYQVDYIPNSGYSVTKSAVNQLGRHWADELEPKGVSVLLVHPGAVATDMNKGVNLITVEESATAVWSVVAKSSIGDGAKGILSYDGTVLPW